MAQDPVDEEDYDSEADEDFNPDQIAAIDEGPPSSDEDEDHTANPKKRKELEDPTDFDNSGDEATITKGRRKKRKGEAKDDDDEGGEGGLVKTRAQRKAEGKEKKPLVQASTSVNVNDLWAQMSAPKPAPSSADTKAEEHTNTSASDKTSQAVEDVPKSHGAEDNGVASTPRLTSPLNSVNDKVASATSAQPMVTIKRTYEFAGERMEEEKLVPAASEEARLFLREQAAASAPASAPSTTGLRRPKKRVSMFDSASNATGPASDKGPKLNTLEKSKLDWATHVDKEGISEELDEQRRAKGNYLSRMDFLSRSDAIREDDAKTSKTK